MNQKFICDEHFQDVHIKKYILKSDKTEVCKYCGRNVKSVEIRKLANFIEENIEFEYDDPYSRGAWYNKEAVYYEDRFPGVTVWDTLDLLQDEVEVDEFEILEDISSYFGNSYWSVIDGIWGPTKNEILRGGWESFKKILKHEVRFLFFNDKLRSNYDNYNGDYFNPSIILDEVGKAIEDLSLTKVYHPKELKIYRGRQLEDSEIITKAVDLGSPPPLKAKANRMSPAGISMFYGAFDKETCLLEIEDKEWRESKIVIGYFENLKYLSLIDFTKFNTIPSIFDEQNRHKREVAKFILSFINDISIPIKPDDSVHIEYIPTQVITEYLRIIVGENKPIDGIIYNSVKNNKGKCVALFIKSNEIFDSIEPALRDEIKTFFDLDEKGIDSYKEFYKLELDNNNIYEKYYP